MDENMEQEVNKKELLENKFINIIIEISSIQDEINILQRKLDEKVLEKEHIAYAFQYLD